MKIIIIICFILVIIYILLSKISKRVNPVDGLYFGGTNGFNLNDKYDLCISRLKHLGVKFKEPDNIQRAREHSMLGLPFYIEAGHNLYNNIKFINFEFEHDCLAAITIHIDYSKYGIEDMYNILAKRITKVLQQEPSYQSKEFSKWSNSKGAIVVTIFHNDILVQILKE